jgi:DNA-binding transcriptional LysR family regulator
MMIRSRIENIGPRNMRELDLDSLRIFKTVADEGGVTRAAGKLNCVQSNVTTRVKQLEARLGTPLFHRRNRKLVLSADGHTLLAYADRMLRLSAEAQAALREGKPRGTFRIGTLESTAASRLPPVLSRYHRDYPDVRIDLVTGTTGALVGRVLNYDIEAAFVAEPFSASGIDRALAFTEELVLIAPKSWGRIASPRDIGVRTIITFATGCAYRRRLEDWLARDKVVPQWVMEFGSYHAILACVAAGAGCALAPQSVLRPILKDGEVAVHPLPRDVAVARTFLIWRSDHQSRALDALREQLARKAAAA